MSKHDFTLRVEVDDAALREHNEAAERLQQGLGLDEDPSEWSFDNIQLAVDEEIAQAEVFGYDAVRE